MCAKYKNGTRLAAGGRQNECNNSTVKRYDWETTATAGRARGGMGFARRCPFGVGPVVMYGRQWALRMGTATTSGRVYLPPMRAMAFDQRPPVIIIIIIIIWLWSLPGPPPRETYDKPSKTWRRLSLPLAQTHTHTRGFRISIRMRRR